MCLITVNLLLQVTVRVSHVNTNPQRTKGHRESHLVRLLFTPPIFCRQIKNKIKRGGVKSGLATRD